MSYRRNHQLQKGQIGLLDGVSTVAPSRRTSPAPRSVARPAILRGSPQGTSRSSLHWCKLLLFSSLFLRWPLTNTGFSLRVRRTVTSSTRALLVFRYLWRRDLYRGAALGLALLNSLAMMSIGQASSPAAPTAVRGKFAVDSPLEGRVHCELVSEIRRRFR